MFAIIETGGKQYIAEAGKTLTIEKIHGAEGQTVTFDKVLLVNDGEKTDVGTPYLSGVSVEGRVLAQGREKKKIVFRYKAKVRRRKKKGHRQPFSRVGVVRIVR